MTQRNGRPCTDQMQKAARGFEMPDEGTVTIPRAAAIVMTRNARRIRLHHALVRHRRWSRELDDLLGSCIDPWDYAEPINWSGVGMDLDVPERDHRGHELLGAGWTP